MFVTGAVYGRLGVNVALNRPTFMKSVWDGNTWGANDGDRTPTKASGSCVSTWMNADPWWAVDLGAALAVLGVLFTSRAEGKGDVSGLRYYFPVYRSQTAFFEVLHLTSRSSTSRPRMQHESPRTATAWNKLSAALRDGSSSISQLLSVVML